MDADDGDLEKVRLLVEGGSDVNAKDSDLSQTPLHYAAAGGHYRVVEYLLSVGSDVNACDEYSIGETPLGGIAQECSLRMAKFGLCFAWAINELQIR